MRASEEWFDLLVCVEAVLDEIEGLGGGFGWFSILGRA